MQVSDAIKACLVALRAVKNLYFSALIVFPDVALFIKALLGRGDLGLHL